VGVTQQVHETEAGNRRQQAEQNGARQIPEAHPVRRRIAVAVVAIVVLGAGWYGSWSYAHAYYVYRGFAPVTDPKGVQGGTLVNLRVWSSALHERRTVLVYLPPGYFRGAAHGHRYPVLYLLHPSMGQVGNYIYAGALPARIDGLLHDHRIPPYISVIPDGHGPDHEWANASNGNFESYVLNVVHYMDRHYSTVRNRSGRAIGGLSMGGYGAANIALQHVAMFSEFASWSGYFTQALFHGPPFAGRYSARVAANSPAAYVPRMRAELRRFPIRAFLYQGKHDDVPLGLMLSFARELRAAGGQVRTAVYPGAHNWRLWHPHFTQVLAWFGQGFRR
jgi:enterochelin esterase-like enzyme